MSMNGMWLFEGAPEVVFLRVATACIAAASLVLMIVVLVV
jgi:hypothetical protein